MEILDRFNKVLIMAAHVHTISHSYLGLEFGRANPNTAHQILVAAASGSWWSGPKDEYGIPSATQRDGSPKGIHHLTFYENSYHERFKAAGLSKSHQIRIEEPSGFKAHSDSVLIHLVVNVFNGSKRSTVEARINHEEWKSLPNKSNGY